jgi:hypothetical protein
VNPRTGAALACAALLLAPVTARGDERVRRTSATVWYRYTSLAVPGGDGDYHGGGASFLPLRALRAGRWLRWEVGAEAGLRAGANGHADFLFFSLTRLGWQRAFARVTPWVVATGSLGLGVQQRFQRNDARWLWSAGAEVGVDLRAVGPLGFTAALGFGRTVEGNIHHDTLWVRAGVAVFP